MSRASFAFVLTLLLPGFVLSQAGTIDYDTAHLSRVIRAVRTEEQIELDGVLKEPAWGRAPVAGDFVQWQPNTGASATQPTEVRFLYDASNLYVGFTAFESDPSRLTVNEIVDDYNFGQSDAVTVILDTLSDDRSGFVFVVNPGGGRRDGQVANDGQTNNFDWDGVWDVAVARNPQGWTAEFLIPFRTLRFSDSPTQRWGVNMTRAVRRINEESQWSPVPIRYRSTRVSLAGTLEGLEDIRQGRNLKVKPFITGGFTASVPATSFSGARERDFNLDGGVDVKYGVTPSLTLDGTYRTDFAQVEVDQQQVNLTRFNLFFPEKREFFLENAGTFAFGGGEGSNLVPFFSRRIGLAADGTPIPIVGGGRLTGQAGRYDVGFLAMRTGERASEDAPPTSEGNTYLVGRLKRNLLTNSWVGALFTDRDGGIDSGTNRVYGADAHFQFYSRLEFDAYLLTSDTPGLSGHDLARDFRTAWRDNEVEFTAGYHQVQPNFNPEVGFVRRRDVTEYTGSAAWNPQIESSGSIRNLLFGTDVDYFQGAASGETETRTQKAHAGLEFQNAAAFQFGIENTFERLTDSFLLSGVAIPVGDYRTTRYSITAGSDPTERLSGNLNVDWGGFWDGGRTSIGGDVTLRPTYRVNVQLNYSHNNVDLGNGRFTTDLAGLRFVYAFTPRAFFNAFLQYNSATREVSSNLRFNIIHHPLSDLFVVYNERRGTAGGDLRDRALLLKLTNLFDF